MKRSGRRARVKVSADDRGVVSHAGTALLRELAEETGLVTAVTGVLLDTYRGVPVHAPGQVFTDLAVAMAAHRPHLAVAPQIAAGLADLLECEPLRAELMICVYPTRMRLTRLLMALVLD